jgi:NAD(P)-dependent dehydrogenase (short-subunit alcohol dehydrogenase family)
VFTDEKTVMSNVLVVGGTRGLGAALVHRYAKQKNTTVFATSRKDAPKDFPTQLSLVYITAGIFKLESFEEPDWDTEVATYLTSAIAPAFIISALFTSGNLIKNATPRTKIILLSSEAGSLALQQAGGGGNYAHHASKSALNMVGTQLRYDLEPHGIAIAMVHPSFMRTEMTKGVGFDVAWDENDALTPEQAAESVGTWTENEFGMDKTGQFWAPRGTRDIGSWKDVTGKDHIKGAVQLPW